ncbi:MAG: iron complex outermembrane receptor protein [Halieaceae bacterium]|jgi:iron complex outermembrane receptor protein
MNTIRAFAISMLPIAFITMPAVAETSLLLEEILVTAQKREQSLQEVGISVTAFSAGQLKSLGYTNTMDIAAQTPALHVQQFHPTLTTVNIRGISQNDFADHLEAPVAMYVDDAYVSSMGAASVQMYDLDRVEVLRGPQGTLFGRNATGGLLHYVSNRPGEEFEGYVELTVAEYDQLRLEGAVSGPLSDRIAGRLSFSRDEHDGYLENRIGDDLRDTDGYSVRGQLQFSVTDNTELLLKASYSEDDANGGGYSHAANTYGPDSLGRFVGPDETAIFFGLADLVDGMADPITGPCTGCDPFGFKEPDDDPHTGSFDQIGFFEREIRNLQARLTVEFDQFTLTSISDYLKMEKGYSEDTDSSPFAQINFQTSQDMEQFSQEIRLNRDTQNARWVAGVYYLDIDNETFGGINQDVSPLITFGFDSSAGAVAPPYNDPSFPCATTGPCPPGIILAGSFHSESVDTESWAIFGHYEYDVTDTVTLTGALRYTDDSREMAITIDNTDFGLPLQELNAGNVPNLDQEWDNYSIRAGVDWRPSEEWLIYASYDRGHKAGNFAAPFVFVTDFSALSHDEEVLESYEVGAKGSFMEGRARLNMSVFYYDYQDYQGSYFKNLSQIIDNLDAEIYGAEVELTLVPADRLEFLFGLSLLESEVENVGLPSGELVDRDLPQAPGYSFNGLGRYMLPAFGGTVTLQADFVYVDDFCFTLVCNHTEEEDSYVVSNARITYDSGDDRWSLAAFVKNLSDEEYRAYALDAGFVGVAAGAYAPPRWYGATATYRW